MRTTGMDAGQTTESLPQLGKGMTRTSFFNAVVEALRPELQSELRAFEHSANPMLLKVYYSNPRVHYEVWCDAERSILGLGLHFEDGPVSTAAYLAYFDRHIVELKHLLGTNVELERWTASWGHMYEHHPLTVLAEPVARDIAVRLAAFIQALQPLVALSDIAPERSTGEPVERSGTWRKWKR